MKKEAIGLAVILVGVILTIVLIALSSRQPEAGQATPSRLHEAAYYEKLENGQVRCQLCPNRCLLAPGQRGLCKVRENIDGKLYSLVYGQVVTTNVDPIEKKPFYHFLPGARAYSLATAGCNLACQYCQNWDIAQRNPEDLESTPMTPEEVVNQALANNSAVIAFTYNEPTVWYEYMLDIAKLAHEKGLKTVMVSSGYINEEPLKELLPHLDAVKIDFKAFDEETYQTLIGGRLEPVLTAMKVVYKSGTWLELVHLIVPGQTDDLEEIKNLCLWVKENLSENVPVHFSRFWPRYKLLNLPPTPEETVKKAREVCREVGLNYVYTGNIDDPAGSTTYCPDNDEPLITRLQGRFIEENKLNAVGNSPSCPTSIPGVWEPPLVPHSP